MTNPSLSDVQFTNRGTHHGPSRLATPSFIFNENSPHSTKIYLQVINPVDSSSHYMSMALSKDGGPEIAPVTAERMTEHLGLPAGIPIQNEYEIGPLNVAQVDAVFRVAQNVAMREHFADAARQEAALLGRTFPVIAQTLSRPEPMA